MCLPEYTPNFEGKCDLISIKGCKSGFSSFDFDVQFQMDKIDDPMIFFENRNQHLGCSTCEEGYTKAYSQMWNKSICSKSNNIEKKITTSSFKNANCLRFSLKNSFVICLECHSEFVLLNHSDTCISKKLLPNCQIAFNQYRCQECSSGYVLNSSGKCDMNLIDNCLESLQGESNQKCLQCENGYYNFNGICIQGSIPHCLIYDFEEMCSQCESGYVLLLDNELNQCVQIEGNQCKSMSIKQGIFEGYCNECNTDFINTFESDEIKTYFYHKIDEIDNCISYAHSSHPLIYEFQNKFKFQTSDISLEKKYEELIQQQSTPSSLFFQNSFCIKCKTNFYLDLYTNSCITQNKAISNCSKYGQISKTCVECQTDYILNQDHTECVPIIKSIEHCHEYHSPTRCHVCGNIHYPKDSKCVPVPLTFQTNNCLYYDYDLQCTKCQSDFLLVNNQCVPLQVSNCLEYVHHKQCRTCKSGYILHQLPSKVISCELKTISNCVQSVSESVLDESNSISIKQWCIQCEPSFYPSNGICLQTSIHIPNCQRYSSADTCMNCETGYALSFSKTSCNSTTKSNKFSISIQDEKNIVIDQNCSEFYHLENPICLLCKKGFIMYQGKCRSCGGLGCLQCDPEDVRKCAICQSGYTMIAQGECLKV
jgi:hypothetical protein